MAGQRNSYGKRSSRPDYEDEGGKRRNSGGVDRETYVPGPDDTVYRYLCQGKKIGSIIGRGGEIVKQLRADTHAKIRIGETVQRCDERVITIFSTSKETNPSAEAGDDVCPAQDALFKVHEKLVAEDNMDEGSDEGSSQLTARLLVPSDQIGSLIGKGGQIIQGIRSDTGAQIRIMKNEHLPACAIATDELVQITGEASAIRKALVQVSSRLHDNPSRSQHLLTSNMSSAYPTNDHYGGPIAAGPLEVLPMMPPYGGYKGERERDWAPYYPPRRDENSVKEFSLRLLCAASNIGGLIGKGGGIIKQIRQESGAYIKIDSSSSEDDSIISISAKELFDDPSPAIDAAVRIQRRCSEVTEKESEESSYTTRLLVPASRIGCLIGKGGSIISEMRRSTGANIRILSKENLPKVASNDEEMVQISGDHDVSREALVQVTTRLKANFFDMEGALSAMPNFPYQPVAPEPSYVSKYAGRENKSHDRGYSSYSSGYGSSRDLPHSDSYRSYGGSQAGASGYGAYSGYSGRSGSSGSGERAVACGGEMMMMMVRRVLTILTAVAALCLEPSVSLRFDLPSGHTKCISEDIKVASMSVGKYTVINPSDGHPLPDSHKITVRVTSPYGNSIHMADHVEAGNFAFTSTEAGDFLACFWTPDHKPATTVSLDFEWRTGVAAKDWTSVAKKGKIDVMELELKKLEDTIKSIHDEMFYLREREEEMQDMNRSTTSKMAWFSFLSLAVCLSVAGLQLWHLKTFFERKKLL